jgi:hypothetical protein
MATEPDPAVCRICSKPKEWHHFVCRDCFNRLPANSKPHFFYKNGNALFL